jgi:hypothetical protein
MPRLTRFALALTVVSVMLTAAMCGSSTETTLPDIPPIEDYDQWDEQEWEDLKKNAQAANVAASDYLAWQVEWQAAYDSWVTDQVADMDDDELAPETQVEPEPPPALGPQQALCEGFDSGINVGSIGEVAKAIEAAGLLPEGVDSRSVGQEVRRMMEVTGEVCQTDLFGFVQNGQAASEELKAAISAAVENVGASAGG